MFNYSYILCEWILKKWECHSTELQAWFLRIRSSSIERGGKLNFSETWCGVCFPWPHSEAPHNTFLGFPQKPNSCQYWHQTKYGVQFFFLLRRHSWHLRHRLSIIRKNMILIYQVIHTHTHIYIYIYIYIYICIYIFHHF